MQLTITESAAKFMRRMVRFSGEPAAAAFRLSVAPGGCAGLSYDFSIESAPETGDAVITAEGVTVFVPETSQPLLDGLIIDFADTLASSGLTFTNPNATGSCGCGTSFQVEGQVEGMAPMAGGSSCGSGSGGTCS